MWRKRGGARWRRRKTPSRCKLERRLHGPKPAKVERFGDIENHIRARDKNRWAFSTLVFTTERIISAFFYPVHRRVGTSKVTDLSCLSFVSQRGLLRGHELWRGQPLGLARKRRRRSLLPLQVSGEYEEMNCHYSSVMSGVGGGHVSPPLWSVSGLKWSPTFRANACFSFLFVCNVGLPGNGLWTLSACVNPVYCLT